MNILQRPSKIDIEIYFLFKSQTIKTLLIRTLIIVQSIIDYMQDQSVEQVLVKRTFIPIKMIYDKTSINGIVQIPTEEHDAQLGPKTTSISIQTRKVMIRNQMLEQDDEGQEYYKSKNSTMDVKNYEIYINPRKYDRIKSYRFTLPKNSYFRHIEYDPMKYLFFSFNYNYSQGTLQFMNGCYGAEVKVPHFPGKMCFQISKTSRSRLRELMFGTWRQEKMPSEQLKKKKKEDQEAREARKIERKAIMLQNRQWERQNELEQLAKLKNMSSKNDK